MKTKNAPQRAGEARREGEGFSETVQRGLKTAINPQGTLPQQSAVFL